MNTMGLNLPAGMGYPGVKKSDVPSSDKKLQKSIKTKKDSKVSSVCINPIEDYAKDGGRGVV